MTMTYDDVPAYTDSSYADGQALHESGNTTAQATPIEIKILRMAWFIIILALALLWTGAYAFKNGK